MQTSELIVFLFSLISITLIPYLLCKLFIRIFTKIDLRRMHILQGLKEVYSHKVDNINKHIPKLLEKGLLQEQDLYIDLTGGEDLRGISDSAFLRLRYIQNCSNASNKRGSILLTKHLKFSSNYREEYLRPGKFIYIRKYDSISSNLQWDRLDRVSKTSKLPRIHSVYIDNGSGIRVNAEWKMKLDKLLHAIIELNNLEAQEAYKELSSTK